MEEEGEEMGGVVGSGGRCAVEGRRKDGCSEGGGDKGWLNLLKKSFSSFALSIVPPVALVFVL